MRQIDPLRTWNTKVSNTQSESVRTAILNNLLFTDVWTTVYKMYYIYNQCVYFLW